MSQIQPTSFCLRRRDLGISVAPGDDSHAISQVGLNIEKGITILQELGFDMESTRPIRQPSIKGKTVMSKNQHVSSSTLRTIGNTPIVQLQKVIPANSADVLIKLEYFNPTGSYKDRMALAMIEEAEARGDLRPGMTVVEYTGGSTGSSLAFVCAVKGYKFKVVSSDAFAEEKLKTMQAFGAELMIVPSEGGKITPDLIPRMMEKSQEDRGS